MNEGLVAPSWSDSGEVPVGEVTEMRCPTMDAMVMHIHSSDKFSFEAVCATVSAALDKSRDPTAKPSNPALCRVAGEAYRGLGWCDEGA